VGLTCQKKCAGKPQNAMPNSYRAAHVAAYCNELCVVCVELTCHLRGESSPAYAKTREAEAEQRKRAGFRSVDD